MLGATHTLLVLTSHHLARIDLAGNRRRLRVKQMATCPTPNTISLTAKLAQAWQATAPSSGSAADADWNASSKGTRSRHDVWVVSTDLWHETISLPLETTLLLSPAEFHRALAIEAESYSGISAFASEHRSRKILDMSSNLADHSRWWVNQISQTDLQSMQSIVTRLGGRFQGAVHPVLLQLGSPASAIDQASLSQSLETWEPSSQKAAPVSDAQFREALEHLVTSFIEAKADRWLTDSVLSPNSTNHTGAHRPWLQALLACLVTLACGGHYWYQSHRLHTAKQLLSAHNRTLERDQQSRQQLQSAEARGKLLKQQLVDLKTKRDQLERSRLVASLKSEPTALPWALLLDELAAQADDRWWIESWEGSPQSTTLHGWARGSECVLELAQHLSNVLAAQSCQVEPPTLREQAGLIRFEIKITITPTFAQVLLNADIIARRVSEGRHHWTLVHAFKVHAIGLFPGREQHAALAIHPVPPLANASGYDGSRHSVRCQA